MIWELYVIKIFPRGILFIKIKPGVYTKKLTKKVPEILGYL